MGGPTSALKERSYWWDTVTMPTPASPSFPAHADVAIIGGGITGLSAARTLARRGAKVAVLEARTIGWGASSRNAGMVLTGLKLGSATVLERYGVALGRELYAASVESVTAVERIVREENIDCHFVRCGHLYLASKPAHFEKMPASAERLERDFSHTVKVLSRDALTSEIGSSIYFGALFDPVSASVNPAQYVAGLGKAAVAAGAALYDRAEVQELTRQGSGWKVTTARGMLEANEILVATSGYTGAATPGLQRKIIPIGSYIIATEPLPEALARELSPHARMMYDSRNFLHYYRLTPDRRMLFGGRARFIPETDASVRESAEVLRAGMLKVYPQLRDTRIDYAWGGTLDFAFDTMPHIGKLDGLHYALGYAGHGVALATLLGNAVGEALAGGDLNASPFARIPFPGAPLGLYGGKPWFLPLAAARYRILDWVS